MTPAPHIASDVAPPAGGDAPEQARERVQMCDHRTRAVGRRLPLALSPRRRRGHRAVRSRSSRRPGGARRGFTLVEVLATLVLMGIVLPVAMRGLSLALAAASVAKHTTEAAALAQTKLNELTTTSATGSLNATGDFAPEHPDYTWTATSTQRDYGLTQLDVRVAWPERDGQRTVDVSTLYVPLGTMTTTTGGTGGTGTGTGATGGTQ
ncbi:MAG TPA: type II secretion system protein [Tepidisphaeraceae bacterium]|nr:type II secretion system protein [Tepidisphaeraceae bacterium]